MQPSEWPVVQTVPSSKGGQTYDLRLSPDGGQMWCSCKAFEYSKAQPPTCKHIDAFLARQGSGSF